jgi:hypothetical protein
MKSRRESRSGGWVELNYEARPGDAPRVTVDLPPEGFERLAVGDKVAIHHLAREGWTGWAAIDDDYGRTRGRLEWAVLAMVLALSMVFWPRLVAALLKKP